MNWFDAKTACEKAGKRLCTEEEWVSACTGEPAVDNNANGFFADDTVEGRMYPYGLFYEAGRCRDAEDEYKGEPGKTGVLAGCRTPEGTYDLAGNLGEWVGATQQLGAQVGGDYRSGERASCNKRSAMWGAGIRNNTTGFRCCADQAVEGPKVAASAVDTSSTQDVLGRPVPKFEVALLDGAKWSSDEVKKNKLTYITFFASWCGPCKRELPELVKFQEEYGKQGFKVVAIGSDRLLDLSKKFVEQHAPNANYLVGHDPDSLAMGLFNVGAMPASFLVDKKGVVRHRHVGFKQEEIAGIVAKMKELLAE
jgi:thiol-disulfide isomerase/thioredoxin